MSNFMTEFSSVASYFNNKHIVITGGSGFLGKLLIQKLFRVCPDIGGIYLIIREKKGVSLQGRLDYILDSPVFDSLKEEVPEFREKLHLILGDLKYEQLGLSESDQELLKEKINIVIHGGASMNFTEKIKEAVYTNVRGTRDLLKLCEQMKHLNCVLCISTAYSNCNYKNIGEWFYKPPMEAETIIKFVDEVDDEVQDKITPQLLGEWPNIYTYTKAITENLIKSKINDFPIGVVRPSIIMPTYKDPLLCWTDNLYGVIGIAVGVGKGILRTIHCNGSNKINIIPADFCVNNMICAIPDIAKQFEMNGTDKRLIYNIVSTREKSINYYQLQEYTMSNYKYKVADIYILPHFYFISSFYWYKICSFFLHYLPAIFIDLILLIIKGEKPKYFNLYRKIDKFAGAIEFFAMLEFTFRQENNDRLWNELNDFDKKLFNFDIRTFEWQDYFQNLSYGLKKYLLKEPMDPVSLKKAADWHKKLEMIEFVVKCLFFGLMAYILWRLFC